MGISTLSAHHPVKPFGSNPISCYPYTEDASFTTTAELHILHNSAIVTSEVWGATPISGSSQEVVTKNHKHRKAPAFRTESKLGGIPVCRVTIPRPAKQALT